MGKARIRIFALHVMGRQLKATDPLQSGRSSTMRWVRFQPPGPGLAPSGIGRPAELLGPASNSRSDPRATSANAGAALERSLNPRCFVYHAKAGWLANPADGPFRQSGRAFSAGTTLMGRRRWSGSGSKYA